MNSDRALFFARYIGLPYERYDCWNLTRLVYFKELGIELPHDPLAARALMVKVDSPEPLDVVVLRGTLGRHVGIMVDRNRLLHSREGTNAVVEHLDSRQVAGFFRHQGTRA